MCIIASFTIVIENEANIVKLNNLERDNMLAAKS